MDTMTKHYVFLVAVMLVSGAIVFAGRKNAKFRERSLWFSFGIISTVWFMILMREFVFPWLFPETY